MNVIRKILQRITGQKPVPITDQKPDPILSYYEQQTDHILALNNFIEYYNQKNVTAAEWFFELNEVIADYMDSLTLEETNELNREMWNWKDETLGSLADPLLNTKNQNIDGAYLYCKIFLHTTIHEDEEYLIENIQACTWIKSPEVQLEFYLKLQDKVTRMNNSQNGQFDRYLKIINEKITAEGLLK